MSQHNDKMADVERQTCHELCASSICCIEFVWPIIGAFIIILSITVIFSVRFSNLEDWPLSVSCYFVLYTISSIGYGDLSPSGYVSKWAVIILIFISGTWLIGIFEFFIVCCIHTGGGISLCKNCKSTRRCKCDVKDDIDNKKNWRILAKIDEYIEDDGDYKDIKRKLYTKIKGNLHLKGDDFTKFITNFLNIDDDDYYLETLKELDKVEPKKTNGCIELIYCLFCCNDKLCNLKTFTYFLFMTLCYIVWFSIWLSVFLLSNNTYITTTFTPFDAFYFGVVSSSSVGYGDFSAFGSDDIIIINEHVNYNNTFYNNNSDLNFTTTNLNNTNITIISGSYGEQIALFIGIWSMIGFIIYVIWVGLISQLCTNCLYFAIYQLCCNNKCGLCQTIYDERLKDKTTNLLEYFSQIPNINDVELTINELPKYHYKPKQKSQKQQQPQLELAGKTANNTSISIVGGDTDNDSTNYSNIAQQNLNLKEIPSESVDNNKKKKKNAPSKPPKEKKRRSADKKINKKGSLDNTSDK